MLQQRGSRSDSGLFRVRQMWQLFVSQRMLDDLTGPRGATRSRVLVAFLRKRDDGADRARVQRVRQVRQLQFPQQLLDSRRECPAADHGVELHSPSLATLIPDTRAAHSLP